MKSLKALLSSVRENGRPTNQAGAERAGCCAAVTIGVLGATVDEAGKTRSGWSWRASTTAAAAGAGPRRPAGGPPQIGRPSMRGETSCLPTSTSRASRRVKPPYPADRLAPVPARQFEPPCWSGGVDAVASPPLLARAPSSRVRSCLTRYEPMSWLPMKISTVSPTTATWTCRRRTWFPRGSWCRRSIRCLTSRPCRSPTPRSSSIG